jgi:hypothetical protein
VLIHRIELPPDVCERRALFALLESVARASSVSTAHRPVREPPFGFFGLGSELRSFTPRFDGAHLLLARCHVTYQAGDNAASSHRMRRERSQREPFRAGEL